MTERYKLICDNTGKPIQIKKGLFTELNSLEDIIDELNHLNSLIHCHMRTNDKLTSLLDEKVKPTYDDLYLDIDPDSKRCKYEETFVCYKCSAFSSCFLDCRLMMGDDQYQKALKLGLVKK